MAAAANSVPTNTVLHHPVPLLAFHCRRRTFGLKGRDSKKYHKAYWVESYRHLFKTGSISTISWPRNFGSNRQTVFRYSLFSDLLGSSTLTKEQTTIAEKWKHVFNNKMVLGTSFRKHEKFTRDFLIQTPDFDHDAIEDFVAICQKSSAFHVRIQKYLVRFLMLFLAYSEHKWLGREGRKRQSNHHGPLFASLPYYLRSTRNLWE